MSKLRLHGASSGYTDIAPTAAAGNNTLTAPTATGTLVAEDGSGNITVGEGLVHTGDTNTKIKFPAADTVSVETSGSEALRIDSSSRLLVGHTASEALYYTGLLQVQGTNSSTSAITVKSNQNDSGGPAIVLAKSRGAVGGTTVVQSGDQLGSIYFNGADGTDADSRAAEIRASVDGTPGSNDMPGRLTFHTTADGASSSIERMRILSGGDVIIGTDTWAYTKPLNVQGSSGAILALSNYDTTSYAADTNTSIELRINTGNTNNTNGTVELRAFKENGTNGDNARAFSIWNAGNGGSNAERVRVTSAGKLLVGRTSAMTFSGDATDHNFEQLTDNGYTVGLHCNQSEKRGLAIYYPAGGTASPFMGCKITTSWKTIIRGDGDLENANNSYGGISDVSMKENIVDANSQWNDIKNIKIRNYNFKASTGQQTHTQIGVIAQELETVSPKLVRVSEDDMKTVSYSVLYLKAVKALQESMTKIETLESKVATLESEMNAVETFESRIAALESA